MSQIWPCKASQHPGLSKSPLLDNQGKAHHDHPVLEEWLKQGPWPFPLLPKSYTFFIGHIEVSISLCPSLFNPQGWSLYMPLSLPVQTLSSSTGVSQSPAQRLGGYSRGHGVCINWEHCILWTVQVRGNFLPFSFLFSTHNGCGWQGLLFLSNKEIFYV